MLSGTRVIRALKVINYLSPRDCKNCCKVPSKRILFLSPGIPPKFFLRISDSRNIYHDLFFLHKSKNHTWKEFPSHDLAAPECRETDWSRDNHLGNGKGGYTNKYNWTLPDLNHENCVLRIRYVAVTYPQPPVASF